MQKHCGTDERYEKKVAGNGKFFFNLKAANSQVIGTSQMDASEQERDASILAARAGGPKVPVRDAT